MKLLYLPFILLLYMVRTEPMDKVADLIRQGNAHELSQLFASSVEITIQNEDNVYSKIQAEMVLEKFFNQNKPKAIRMLHKVNSNPNYHFNVLILTTDNGTFRIAYTLKETAGNFLLIEMRIEAEKVK